MGADDIKVEVIHKEIIKPSSPTPPHLKILDLSIYDQFPPEIYVPLLLLYPRPTSDHEVDIDHYSWVAGKSSLLKASLSKTLTHFYPFAGTYQFNDSIRCDDHGVVYNEGTVNCRISKVLEKPDLGMLGHLFPAAVESTQAIVGYLLLIQVNFFECGGMAIAVSISHKVTDVFTLSKFINCWATVTLTSSTPELPLEFGAAASLFPPHDFFNSPNPAVEFVQAKCTTRRFVFDALSIATLKSEATSAAVPNPTRVEVVSALIWKCAMEASTSSLGFRRPSLWSQMVNMRKRSGRLDALTESLLGNYVWYYAALTSAERDEVNLQNLVTTLRKCMKEFTAKHPHGVSAEQVYESIKQSGNIMAQEGTNNYSCTSWCWFPFNEANFGWGKPSWVSIRSLGFKNTVLLVDGKDGIGIEAFLTFLDEEMTIFERNQELLAYASLNPSVIY